MSTKSSQPPPSLQSTNLAARSWMSCLGLMCILMGSLFVWYLWAAYQKATITDSWVETPAVITSSKIDDSQLTQHYTPKYRLDLTYDYEYQGEKMTGTKIRRLATESGDLQKIKKKEAKYPVGAEVTAIVNPENPTDVILDPDSKGSLYSIWFPCLFIVGGLGIIVANVFRKKQVN